MSEGEGFNCNWRFHWDGDICTCEARLQAVTGHTKIADPEVGPPYCQECSQAVSEWVPWGDGHATGAPPKPSDTYEWPCSKRKPHEKHDEITEAGILECPGVRAHPDVQIGREPAPVAVLATWKELSSGG